MEKKKKCSSFFELFLFCENTHLPYSVNHFETKKSIVGIWQTYIFFSYGVLTMLCLPLSLPCYNPATNWGFLFFKIFILYANSYPAL